jgi:hypothetical protein
MELVNKKPDELWQGDAVEAYDEIAKQLLYEPLGMLPDDELNEFVLNPGTLEERAWRKYKWNFPPENETVAIWWVCNKDESDHTKETKLIFRSLAALRMALFSARLATSQKLR